jgi:hypothetical protein
MTHGNSRRARNPRSNDRDRISGTHTLGEQFFDVSVRQAVAEVPPDGQQDHVRRERSPGNEADTGWLRRFIRARYDSHSIRQRNIALASPEKATQQCLARVVGEIDVAGGGEQLVLAVDEAGEWAVEMIGQVPEFRKACRRRLDWWGGEHFRASEIE